MSPNGKYPIKLSSQESINTFQKVLMEEFDEALSAYLAVLNSPLILAQLRDKRFTLLYTKIYLYSNAVMITILSGIFYRLSSEKMPFMHWIQGLVAYVGFSYFLSQSASHFFPNHDNMKKVVTAFCIISTSIFMLSSTKYTLQGAAILILFIVDQRLTRELAAGVINIMALFSNDRSHRWIVQNMLMNSDQIIRQGKELLQKKTDIEAGFSLKLPEEYLNRMHKRQEDYQNSSTSELLSLEDIFVKALETLSWRDQLSIRLTLKLFTNVAIAEEFTKLVMCEFYQQNFSDFTSEDLETRKDFLYSVISYHHALVPTSFQMGQSSRLSNAPDDAATYESLRRNPQNTLHIKHGFRVEKIEDIRVAEDEFMGLYDKLSACVSRLFTDKKRDSFGEVAAKKRI